MDDAALTVPRRALGLAATASVAVHALALAGLLVFATAPLRPIVAPSMATLDVTIEAPLAPVTAAPADLPSPSTAAPAAGDARETPPDRSPPASRHRVAVPATPMLSPAPIVATLPVLSVAPPVPDRPMIATPPALARLGGSEATVATSRRDDLPGDAMAKATTPEAPSPAAVQAGAPATPIGYRDRPTPAYPEAARRIGAEGLAIVDALVSREGAPVDVALARSSGHASLDAAALDAVRHWRFVPATRDGEAIAARIAIPVRFRLTDAER